MIGAQAHATLAALRRFARPEPAAVRCDLCAATLLEPHDHLLDVQSRRLACACLPCSMLFPSHTGGVYRRIVSCQVPLPGIVLDDPRWNALGIPVRLVFIVASAVHGRVFALYPNAAGLSETVIASAAWDAFVSAYPVLAEIEPDVQGLLVDGISDECQCFRASIDVCHRLAGLMRDTSGRSAVSSELRYARDRVAHE
jgi:hypothetical protein